MNSSERPEYTVISVTSVACSSEEEHPVRMVAKRARTTANRADFVANGIESLEGTACIDSTLVLLNSSH
jgi:hypothetical protein